MKPIFACVFYMCVFVLVFAGMMTSYRVVHSELWRGEGIWNMRVYEEGVIFYISVLFEFLIMSLYFFI